MNANDISSDRLSVLRMQGNRDASVGIPMTLQSWKIVVDSLIVEANVGMLPHEYGAAQPVVVDAELRYDQPPVEDDSLGLIDYDEWCSTVERYVSTKPHTRLLETLAVDIAMLSFKRWPTLASVTLFLYKPKIRPNAARLGIALHLCRDDALSRF